MASLSHIFILLMMSVICSSADNKTCPAGQIHCNNNSNQVGCISESLLCDGNEDCHYGRDEEPEFCQVMGGVHYWDKPCEGKQILCVRYGIRQCMSPMDFCKQDVPCERALDWRVCKILNSGLLSYLSFYPYDGEGPAPSNIDDSVNTGDEFRAKNPLTLYHEECPQLYTKVGNDCVSFLHPVNVTWGEARVFCQTIGGDLLSFRDLEHFTQVRTRLNIAMQHQDFWIGGRYLVDEGKGWTWLTDEPMPVGFPLWTMRYEPDCQERKVISFLNNQTQRVQDDVCYHYTEAPRPVQVKVNYYDRQPPNQTLCVAITYQYNYRLSDEDCLHKKSPLCIATPSN